MKALITGASSGIGRDMARYLSSMGYDVIVVARRLDRLEELKNELKNIEIVSLDISNYDNCLKLFNKYSNIDILINNAGFGVFGSFNNTDLARELEMIDTNIKAVHILTKLYLKEFVKKDKGYILNVASTAGFFSGPLMDTYYATKGYVLKLTEGIKEELNRIKSNVYIGALCPGPTDTEFNNVAKVKFMTKSLSSEYVARYGIDNMFKRKVIIIPGFMNKMAVFFSRFISRKRMIKMVYNIQRKKEV